VTTKIIIIKRCWSFTIWFF